MVRSWKAVLTIKIYLTKIIIKPTTLLLHSTAGCWMWGRGLEELSALSARLHKSPSLKYSIKNSELSYFRISLGNHAFHKIVCMMERGFHAMIFSESLSSYGLIVDHYSYTNRAKALPNNTFSFNILNYFWNLLAQTQCGSKIIGSTANFCGKVFI